MYFQVLDAWNVILGTLRIPISTLQSGPFDLRRAFLSNRSENYEVSPPSFQNASTVATVLFPLIISFAERHLSLTGIIITALFQAIRLFVRPCLPFLDLSSCCVLGFHDAPDLRDRYLILNCLASPLLVTNPAFFSPVCCIYSGYAKSRRARRYEHNDEHLEYGHAGGRPDVGDYGARRQRHMGRLGVAF